MIKNWFQICCVQIQLVSLHYGHRHAIRVVHLTLDWLLDPDAPDSIGKFRGSGRERRSGGGRGGGGGGGGGDRVKIETGAGAGPGAGAEAGTGGEETEGEDAPTTPTTTSGTVTIAGDEETESNVNNNKDEIKDEEAAAEAEAGPGLLRYNNPSRMDFVHCIESAPGWILFNFLEPFGTLNEWKSWFQSLLSNVWRRSTCYVYTPLHYTEADAVEAAAAAAAAKAAAEAAEEKARVAAERATQKARGRSGGGGGGKGGLHGLQTTQNFILHMNRLPPRLPFRTVQPVEIEDFTEIVEEKLNLTFELADRLGQCFVYVGGGCFTRRRRRGGRRGSGKLRKPRLRLRPRLPPRLPRRLPLGRLRRLSGWSWWTRPIRRRLVSDAVYRARIECNVQGLFVFSIS